MEFDAKGKTTEGFSIKRKEPSIDRLGAEKSKQLEDYVKEYSKFLNKCRTPDLVGEWMVDVAEDYKFVEHSSADEDTKDFYVINDDHTTFALVKRGRRPITDGVRVICTHTDAPALQVKPKPIIFSLDAENQAVHLGAELDTFAYGGIQNYQWLARNVDILGWHIKNGRRKRIKFSGTIPDISAHVDTRGLEGEEIDEAFMAEHLDIVTGYTGFKELLKSLNFKSEEEFARSRLWAVPQTKTNRLENLLSGYGHDDRACTFAAVQALLAVKRPKYTSMVIGFDKEEIDSPGKDAARGNFFEKMLLLTGELEGTDESKLNHHFLFSIYDKSMVLSGDLDIGGARREERLDLVDTKNVAKLGYGVFISGCDGSYGGNQVSPGYVDNIMCLFEKNKIIKQVIGSPHPADEMDSSGSMAELFTNRGIRAINVGIGATGLHSPTEIIHVGDFYWMLCGYETFFSKSELKKMK